MISFVPYRCCGKIKLRSSPSVSGKTRHWNHSISDCDVDAAGKLLSLGAAKARKPLMGGRQSQQGEKMMA